MIQPTQTMECTTEVPYISIYDRPKRPRGRPKTCTLTDEEKAQRKRDIATKYHYDNYEYCKMRQRLQKQTVYVSKKMKLKKQLNKNKPFCCFRFFMNFN